MHRRLNVATDVATLLPASHIAQLSTDALGSDNVCVACAAPITGDAAELVVLQDERVNLARLAHSECVASGVYAWEGTSAAAAALTLDSGGLDVATALVWRPAPAPRAIVLVEPRIHISLDAADVDPLQRLFAAPLGLHPISDPIGALAPPDGIGSRLAPTAGGLVLASDALRVTVPSDPQTVQRWRAHVDGDRAIVILGRGLGIARSDAELAAAVDEALRLRPCWGATVPVVAREG